MTVVDARVDQLNITWLCNSDNGTDRQVKQPDSLIQKEDVASVRILNFFEPCTMQMGDRSFYVVKEADVFTKKSKWKRNQLKRIHGRTESNSEELKDEEVGLTSAPRSDERYITMILKYTHHTILDIQTDKVICRGLCSRKNASVPTLLSFKFKE